MGRRERFPVIRWRRWVQIGFLATVLAIGAQFTVWALSHMGGANPPVSRPAGVEGFLPISALMSLRIWLSGGGIHPVHPAGLAVLVAVLAMSAVVAKSFCSMVCPVGAVSEGLGRLGRRLMGRTWEFPRWLDIPLRSLKYLLLLFFAWAVLVSMEVTAVRAFLDAPYNRVADAKMLMFFLEPSRTTVAVLGILAVGSVLVRDLWCRYLCPYGALVGILGRLALFKVSRNPDTCTDCRACTRVCPARLPVHRLGRVASFECTSCQDCVAACPVKDCLTVRSPRWSPLGLTLRPMAAIAVAAAFYLGITAAFRLAGHWHSSVSETEYAWRLKELDAPIYTHAGGRAPAEPRGPSLAESHDRQ